MDSLQFNKVFLKETMASFFENILPSLPEQERQGLCYTHLLLRLLIKMKKVFIFPDFHQQMLQMLMSYRG